LSFAFNDYAKLQNYHRRITRRTFAGFIYRNSTIFEFRVFWLVLLCVVRYEARVNQSCFCLDCRCDILPRTIGTIPTLNVIRDNPSGVNGLFPIEKYPALALLRRFQLSRLGRAALRRHHHFRLLYSDVAVCFEFR
jgi:hypothetical protein